MTKAVVAAAHVPSYPIGAKLLDVVGGISISSRHLNNLTVKVGSEIEAARDARTAAYFEQPLPRTPCEPETPIALACVSVDGGRMQTRLDGGGPGVHDPHWRETKNALFLRMNGVSFEKDPHPELSACFHDRRRMKKLLPGVEPLKDGLTEDPQEVAEPRKKRPPWRPEALFRTCISSLARSDKFGRMMAAEADSRGFYRAAKQAFVCDGLAYNWTIQQTHFPTFTPILDFVHAVEHIYAAARCVRNNEEEIWQLHLQWAQACWQGRVREVVAWLRQEQEQIGHPPTDAADNDPRKIVADKEKVEKKVNGKWQKVPTGRMVEAEVIKYGSAHDLRRAFATRWAPRVKPPTLQLLMRHSSIETTLRYYVAQDAAEVGDELWAAWGNTEAGSKGENLDSGNTFGNNGPQRAENEEGASIGNATETP